MSREESRFHKFMKRYSRQIDFALMLYLLAGFVFWPWFLKIIAALMLTAMLWGAWRNKKLEIFLQKQAAEDSRRDSEIVRNLVGFPCNVAFVERDGRG